MRLRFYLTGPRTRLYSFWFEPLKLSGNGAPGSSSIKGLQPENSQGHSTGLERSGKGNPADDCCPQLEPDSIEGVNYEGQKILMGRVNRHHYHLCNEFAGPDHHRFIARHGFRFFRAPVPAAQITITNTATGLTRNASSNDAGDYVIADIPYGPYEIAVVKQGFQRLNRTGVQLNVGDRTTIDLQLSVGAVSDTITVTEQARSCGRPTPHWVK